MSVCAECQEPLVIHVNADDTASTGAGPSAAQQTTCPDDLELPCQCHFHWECLFESCETNACPNCATDLSGPQILCNVYNEGGRQTNVDILPRLREEHYLRAHPEERKCQAFIELCQEGDVGAIVDLLTAEDDDVNDDDEGVIQRSRDEILRYQNSLGGLESGLHAAIAGGSREVAWMLLLLASNLPELEFPAVVFQEAAQLGIMRTEQAGLSDIRTLRDSEGRTAAQLAAQAGVIWHGWAERLTIA